jgi:dolichyl-phosphate-mannose--protein O-mannosyl transferase
MNRREKMIKSKKLYIRLFSCILSALCLLIIIGALLKKDYSTLIKLLSGVIGFTFYQIMDSKVVDLIRKRVIKKDLLNAIISIISIIIFITNFVLLILTKNKYVESVNYGLIFPSVYFATKYWNIWMEDNETDSSKV